METWTAEPGQVSAPGPGESEPDDADGRLVRRIAEGDRTALSTLYERHAPVLLAQVELLVADRGLAEEILQDTMLAVWRTAGSFEGRSRVRTWLVAIARRQARDRLRRRRANVVGEDFFAGRAAPGPGPEDVALDRAEVASVAVAIGELPLIHREVLGLVFGADLTLAETAEVLGIPLGTVKSRLSAARSALARKLGTREDR